MWCVVVLTAPTSVEPPERERGHESSSEIETRDTSEQLSRQAARTLSRRLSASCQCMRAIEPTTPSS